MVGPMPQLNEAETKFFESGGQEMAPSLIEGVPERATETETGGEATLEAAKPETPEPAAEKPVRQEKFVPLQALQQERAEKKQLRDELRAYREWQAQLAERLRQFPQPAAQPAPDPQTKPLDYINHVLGNVQATTAELQQWRQQQEQAAEQRAAARQTADWATAQEQEFARTQPEYPEAYRYAAEARDRELQALGYADPAQRAAIMRQNTAEIVNNALQQGRNPAELVWEYARARGFVARNERPAMGSSRRDDRADKESALDWARSRTAQRPGGADGNDNEAHSKIAAGLQAAGAKLNQGGATGEGELSAKDLSGITDPDEFERAWKKVFGKRR